MIGPISTEVASLTEAQFNEISAFVKGLCGINLHDGKKELVKARLNKRIRKLGMTCFEQYMQYVREDATGNELVAMLDALSTNLTYFYREGKHFEFFAKTALPELRVRNAAARRLRLWSAGCSSGEEPYTLSMVLHEEMPALGNWDVRILATDISTKVLGIAREGLYEKTRMRDMPASFLSKYFDRLGDRARPWYAVKPSVRKLVSFARLNLMEDWPMKGPFDVIFCRNVMIYFDKPTQDKLIERFWRLLAHKGWLLMGHSESLTGNRERFRYIQPATYQKA